MSKSPAGWSCACQKHEVATPGKAAGASRIEVSRQATMSTVASTSTSSECRMPYFYSGSLLSRAVRVVLKRTHGSAAYARAPASAPHEYRVGSSGRMPPVGGSYSTVAPRTVGIWVPYCRYCQVRYSTVVGMATMAACAPAWPACLGRCTVPYSYEYCAGRASAVCINCHDREANFSNGIRIIRTRFSNFIVRVRLQDQR